MGFLFEHEVINILCLSIKTGFITAIRVTVGKVAKAYFEMVKSRSITYKRDGHELQFSTPTKSHAALIETIIRENSKSNHFSAILWLGKSGEPCFCSFTVPVQTLGDLELKLKKLKSELSDKNAECWAHMDMILYTPVASLSAKPSSTSS